MTPSPPTESPSPGPSKTRKRQRSHSMQSESSEASVKRTTTSDTAPNDDIDAYMAVQDGGAPGLTGPQKCAMIEEMAQQTMEVGQKWFLISAEWWRRWRKACTGEVDKEGGVAEAELGPVDNRPLVDEYGNLKAELVEGVDVKFVPAAAWSKLIEWYGPSETPLERNTITRGIMKQVGLELHPPRLRVLRVALTDSPLPVSDRPVHPYVTLSATDTMSTLCRELKKAVVPDDHDFLAPALIWKVEPSGDDFNGAEYPLAEFKLDHGISIDPSNKTLEDEGIQSEDAFVVELALEDGSWVSKSPVQKPVFSSTNNFFNRMPTSTTQPKITTTTTRTIDSGYSNSIFKSPAKIKPIDPGTLGLGNMGNTCFMNSALQCLAHTKELVDYFLTGLFKDELNPDNPLGMQGAIAESFGSLMERIWDPASGSTSYSPRDFKSQLQRFAPQFSGYQQHDSQELVAFLLDGLHEDLNRVLKKPYVEKPDWEGGGDVELAKLAQISWDGYMKRNDSVIVDLFQGQYQSTLICPECQKVSITFDPFMYLTLPLPIKKQWKHDIFWIPWDSEKPHCKVPLEIHADASFKDIRALLGRWMNVNPDNLLTLEIWSGKFYKLLNDHVVVSELADSDVIVCYELPCHSRLSRNRKPDPSDPFIVPVFLNDAAAPSTSGFKTMYPRNASNWGHPTIVVIDQEAAKDPSAMYDAVIDRLRPWTSNVRDLYKWEGEQPIHITGSNHVPEAISEINENGDVITVQEAEVEEGDIVDQKHIDLEDEPMDVAKPEREEELRRVGTKPGIFTLRLHTNYVDYGATTGTQAWGSKTTDMWEKRKEESEPVLLRENDAFVLEFDDNLKQYFFGDAPKYESAGWNQWKLFVHPEYKAAQDADDGKKKRNISLQDCLDEFTKQEQLGEDDLWYCPQCKKHQQATKKFDLWKVPDVLVVHLKRFSNSRTLRDKIDVLVDFPTEGLDLTAMVGERAVAERLVASGAAVEELSLGDVDGSLVYDLFGVDEHIGGLGGGHYRAYALNHSNDQWYHFDDSYVTAASAKDAVNPSAYLLFYRRRSSVPLGGKTHDKIEAARLKPKDEGPSLLSFASGAASASTDTKLPGPHEIVPFSRYNRIGPSSLSYSDEDWAPPRLRSGADDPPAFDDDTDMQYSNQFPEPSSSASPTSSNEAEVDSSEYEDTDNPGSSTSSPYAGVGRRSPVELELEEDNPFADANTQKP